MSRSTSDRRLALQRAIVTAALALRTLPTASAHEGLPYPILQDKAVPGFSVSVWTDPDVGQSTFFVILEPTGPKPAEPAVEIHTQPSSKRLPLAVYPATRQPFERIQYLAAPWFDRAEQWQVEVVLSWPDAQVTLPADVEVTPDGAGAWAWGIYLLPCLVFGLLWAWSLVARGDRPQRRSGEARS